MAGHRENRKTRFASFAAAGLALACVFAISAGSDGARAAPRTPSEHANTWVKKQIGRTPRIIDSVLNAPSDLIVGRQVSEEMGKILQRINARLSAETGTIIKPGRRHGRCGMAAVNKASTIASDAARSRILRGGGAVGIDSLSAAINVPGGLLKYAAGETAKKAEAWAYDQIRKSDPEDYTNARTIGPCNVQIRVVWIKKTSEYRFLIAGDCRCNRVKCFLGERAEVKLAKWTVTGGGSITPEVYAGLKNKTMVRFRVGSVRKLAVSANCCGQTYTTGPASSWTQVPGKPTPAVSTPPTPVTKTPKTPKTPAHGVPAPGYLPVKVPAIPTGKLCSRDLEKLIEAAANARANAIYNRIEARKHKARLETALSDGKPGVTQADVDAAATEYGTRRDAERKAERTFRKILELDHKPCGSGDSHSMLDGGPANDATGVARGDDENEDTPRTDPGQAVSLSFAHPAHCRTGRACPMTVRLTNRGTAALTRTLVLQGAFDGMRWTSVRHDANDAVCRGAGAGVVCSLAVNTLQPGETVSVRIPGGPRRGSRSRGQACWSLASMATATPHLVQFALTQAGYRPGPVDGVVGPATRRALAAARNDAGLLPGQGSLRDLLTQLMPNLPARADGLNACGTIKVRRPAHRAPAPETAHVPEERNPAGAQFLNLLMTGAAIALEADRHRRHHRRHRGHRGHGMMAE